MPWTRAIPSLHTHCQINHCPLPSRRDELVVRKGVPDGEDTAGLGEAGLLLHTADPLLEDGGNLGGSSLGVGSIAAELVGGGVEDGRGRAGLGKRKREKSAMARCGQLQRDATRNPAPQPHRSGRGIDRKRLTQQLETTQVAMGDGRWRQ